MKRAIIKILKKIEIDFNSQGTFEQKVLQETFDEFKQQFTHTHFQTWESFIIQNPDNVTQVNELISRSMNISIRNLRGVFPGGFKDFSGSFEIKFEKYSLRILESDKANINSHKIAIDFHFPEMTLLDSFENKIIVAIGDVSNSILSNLPINTFIIELDSSISINSYKSF